MTTPAKHSPLPWISRNTGTSVAVFSRSGTEQVYCERNSVQDESNARYIVQACNAFPALYAALEECFTEPFAHCLVKEDKIELYRRICAINDTVRAALALARGEKGGQQ